MKKIESIDELKKIQLDILLSLHQFCSKNNIKYSLAAGTLIGAVRHKGFIPWDDDIDVYLLREDYNKLVSLFPAFYDEKYVLISMERDTNWHRAYGKLYDNRTIDVERTRNEYNKLGVGIDVFPIDDVPDNIEEWEKYEKKRRFYRDLMTLKSLYWSNERTLAKNIITIIGRLLLSPFSFSFFSKLMSDYSQIHNNKGFKHVYENCLGVYNSKNPWLKEDISEVIEAPFEKITIYIMKGFDDYLTAVYGDYMKLPPEEKRVSHHSFTAYWK